MPEPLDTCTVAAASAQDLNDHLTVAWNVIDTLLDEDISNNEWNRINEAKHAIEKCADIAGELLVWARGHGAHVKRGWAATAQALIAEDKRKNAKR